MAFLPLFAALLLVVNGAYLQFSYTNCGSSSDPIQVAPGISLTPSPIIFGQNVTATAKVTFAQPVSNATAGTLTFSVQKHIGIWVDIPCSTIPGGCTYPNFCEVSKKPIDPKTCSLLKSLGLPCGCPIPAGTYAVNNLNRGPVPKPPSSLDFLIDGSFKVKFQLNDSSGNRLICGEIVDSEHQ